ncbi:elongation factor P [Candidatus Pacebacteria bacterium]|nr:elongation factor P [Candidatus Paceibacterota bacterium]
MAKINYNEILPKRTVIMAGDPYLVINSTIIKKGRGKASNNVKMKNLRNGGVVDLTFHQADKLEEAELEKREIKYLYQNKGEYFFCEPENSKERFSFGDDVVGDLGKYIKENSIVEAIVFNDTIMSVSTPIKVSLVVAEASEAVKGNTSSSATKEVTLETGLLIQVPQFINQGDTVAVNTESGQYSERIEKA